MLKDSFRKVPDERPCPAQCDAGIQHIEEDRLRPAVVPRRSSDQVRCRTSPDKKCDTEYCECGGKTGEERRMYKIENKYQLPVVQSLRAIVCKLLLTIVLQYGTKQPPERGGKGKTVKKNEKQRGKPDFLPVKL